MVKVQVPATSANLGPGFDCMGLAVTLYNTFSAQPSETFSISLGGTYTRYISIAQNNLLWTTMCHLWDSVGCPHQSVALTLDNDVPPARGLGSSSTAVVGGLLLANALAGSPLERGDLLRLACEIEGHPDNVTPAFLGGITLTVLDGTTIVPRLLATHPLFKVVVVIPEILLETEKARAILPQDVSRTDAVFNASRVGLLVDSFLRQDYGLLAIATQDRIHQNQRATLIPGLSAALQAALNTGAYGAVLSGSGPTLLAFCSEETAAPTVAALQDSFRQHQLASTAHILDVDNVGAQIL